MNLTKREMEYVMHHLKYQVGHNRILRNILEDSEGREALLNFSWNLALDFKRRYSNEEDV